MKKSFKNIIKAAHNKYNYALLAALSCQNALALEIADLTQDLSGGKTAKDIGENIYAGMGWGLTLLLGVCTLIGVVIVALSLIKMRKMSNENNSHESPVGPIAGIVIGGCLTAVGVITFISKSSLLG
ncbi:hypothetical protein [Citrobacter freundii]|uniref:hypothetical protein n=1 Tax=Citrobacter freundii TaxID=546 RepID=UPI0019030BD8|nr:hypothetical protein [Citrobacter freundii]MBJ8931599.1 hypothetical protein [Citrobacter freundii]